MGIVDALKKRIDALEQLTARHSEELRHEQDLHIERQNALLATIEVLEERILKLERAPAAVEDACSSCRGQPASPDSMRAGATNSNQVAPGRPV